MGNPSDGIRVSDHLVVGMVECKPAPEEKKAESQPEPKSTEPKDVAK